MGELMLYEGFLLVIYPIMKIVFTVGFISSIIKRKKENNEDNKNIIASNYLIGIMLTLYIISLVGDILALKLRAEEYLYIIPVITLIVFLILFILSKIKKINKKVITLIIIIFMGFIQLSIIFSCIGIIREYYEYNYSKINRNKKLYEEHDGASHNSEYEAYFGDIVSAANTKALLQKIKTNNILYSAQRKSTATNMPIYVVYENKKEMYTDPSNLISLIRSSKHYKVSVYNEETTDEDPESIIDEEKVVLKEPEDWAGYYSNGYIRTILIEELESESVNNKIQ